MDVEKPSNLFVYNTAGATTVKLISAPLLFANQIIIAKLLGAGNYGNYVYVLAWMNMLVMISKFGFDVSTIRFVSVYTFQAKWELLRGFNDYSRKIILALSTISGVGLAVAAFFIRHRVSCDFFSSMLVAAIILPLMSFLQYQLGLLKGFGKVTAALFYEDIIKPFIMMSVVVVAILEFEIRPSSTLVMLIYLSAIALLFLMASWQIYKLNPLRSRNASTKLQPSLWRSTSGFLLLSACFNFALFQMDTLMVGALGGTTQAGIYNVACGLVRVMILIPLAVAAVISPVAASNYSESNRTELQRLLSISLTITSLSSVLILAFLFLTGNWLLNMVGKEYIEGYTALCILSVAHAGNALAIPLLSLLNMTDNHIHVFRIFGCASALNLVLDVALIPKYGMIGAAVALAISLSSICIASALAVKQNLKLVLKPTFLPD